MWQNVDGDGCECGQRKELEKQESENQGTQYLDIGKLCCTCINSSLKLTFVSQNHTIREKLVKQKFISHYMSCYKPYMVRELKNFSPNIQGHPTAHTGTYWKPNVIKLFFLRHQAVHKHVTYNAWNMHTHQASSVLGI